MTQLTPTQRQTRDRFEALIRLAAPGLNLILGFGERLSRIVESDDPEYYPPRPTGDVPLPGSADRNQRAE